MGERYSIAIAGRHETAGHRGSCQQFIMSGFGAPEEPWVLGLRSCSSSSLKPAELPQSCQIPLL